MGMADGVGIAHRNEDKVLGGLTASTASIDRQGLSSPLSNPAKPDDARSFPRDFLYGAAAIADHLGVRLEVARDSFCPKPDFPAWREGKMWCARRSAVDQWLQRRERSKLNPRADDGEAA